MFVVDMVMLVLNSCRVLVVSCLVYFVEVGLVFGVRLRMCFFILVK